MSFHERGETIIAGSRWTERVRARLHEFVDAQRQLHDGYVNRYAVSGQESVRALHELHWCGEELAGEFLPDLDPTTAGKRPGDDSHLWT